MIEQLAVRTMALMDILVALLVVVDGMMVALVVVVEQIVQLALLEWLVFESVVVAVVAALLCYVVSLLS